MRYIHRELEKQIVRARRAFPAVVLTGLRRAGPENIGLDVGS